MVKEIDEIRKNYMDILGKCLNEIQYIYLQVYNNIYYLDYFEKFIDVFEIMGYIFKNKEFRKFLVKVNILVFIF